jgi:hypothetical protein
MYDEVTSIILRRSVASPCFCEEFSHCRFEAYAWLPLFSISLFMFAYAGGVVLAIFFHHEGCMALVILGVCAEVGVRQDTQGKLIRRFTESGCSHKIEL